MAITVTPNLTTVALGATGDAGTWVGDSGAIDTEVFKQGISSWYYQTPKSDIGDGNFAPTTAIDMSAADMHLYWWMKCDIFSFCELLNTGATSSGLMVKIESSTTDYITWHIAGSDTWGGEWKAFTIDVNNTANKYATVGTLDLSAVTKISWLTDNSNSGNIRIVDNTNLDAIRFGTGLTLTGTSYSLMDAALNDELIANKYGILEILDGNIHCQGRITHGNGATTTTFNSTDEEIVFKDVIVSSNLYQYNFVGSGNVSVIKGFVTKGAGSATFALDASDVNADVTISGSTFIRAGLIDFASTSDVQTSVFNNCGQIDPSTGTFKNNSISNYVGADGALLWPSDDSNIADLTFAICDNDVEYDVNSDSTATFVNITHDDNTGDYDVNNTSGAAVTINLNGTSNANSYNPAGDTVTFNATVTLTFTVESDSGALLQYARINIVNASTKVELYQIETNVSGVATQAHTYAGDLNIEGWVRQMDLAGDDYTPKDFSGTIKSTGFDSKIILNKI